MRVNRSGRAGAIVAVLVVVAIGGAALAWKYLSGPQEDKPPAVANGSPRAGQNGEEADALTVVQESLNLAVEAVAAAEDADFERGIKLWKQLLEFQPGNADLQLNQAVTVLKWIDVSHSRLSSGAIKDPQEIEKFEAELDDAYLQADEVIAALADLETADYRAILLQAALLEAKARMLKYPDDQELRRQAAETLAAELRANPDSVPAVLACKFDDLAQELADDGDSLMKLNGDSLLAAWKSEPRNLYLLSRATETLLRNHDRRVLSLLEPSLELTKPMLSMVSSSVKRVNPPELFKTVRAAIEAGDWGAAQRLRWWLNVFKGMSGFKSDARLVKPDIMALLDTTFLDRLALESARVTDVLKPKELKFRTVDVAGKAVQAYWYDYDLDLDFDVLALSGNRLVLSPQEDGQFPSELQQELSFSETPGGVLIADFFEVDLPSRPKNGDSVAALMNTEENPGQFRQEPAGDEPRSTGSRHDTLQELLVWGAGGVSFVSVQTNVESRARELYVLDSETGLEEVKGITAAVTFDLESDGDLDVFLATADGLRIFQNNGNRTFREISQFSQTDALPKLLTSMVAVDYDSDLDQDVIAVSPDSGSLLLLENILHGQFRFRALDGENWPALNQPSVAAVADIDGNAAWDWIANSDGQIWTTTLRSIEPGRVAPIRSESVQAEATLVSMADLDNDGQLELVAAGAGGLHAMRRTASGWSAPTTLADVHDSVTSLNAMDCNRDGGVDLLVAAGGGIRVLMSESSSGEFLEVRVRGINDDNGGGRINHFAVGTTLEVWSGGRRHRRIVRQPVVHFGLGDSSPVNLRVVFPNGLTQNLETPVASTLVEELQELKGSCPFVYGWNGERFELITDCLWNAPLGLQVSRGQVLADRRWENLALPGELVQLKDGFYELRMTEELWEVAYFDHIRLTAVDHPEGTRFFTNEKVGPPTIAQPRVFVFRDLRNPTSAFDSRGRSVLRQISQKDQDYAQAFERLVCQGLAEPHFLELDFGPLPEKTPLHLVLTGWMHPTDTSLNIAISQSQHRSPPESPSLWVVDERGKWVVAKSVMGFPGGKPKSIVVDISDVFLSSDHRIRIGSSQQIYWDQAQVHVGQEESERLAYPLQLVDAELRYRGFSKLLPRRMDQPHWYDYQNVSLLPKWLELEGPFTRFGNVLELLAADDDRMVVMTAGDEIRLRFRPPAESLPNGWRRDFVLHSVGWDKDADLNTLAGQGSLPLPFARQEAYPPEPHQSEESEAVWQLNAETLGRKRQIRRFGSSTADTVAY